ncbi:hypothetical protein [Massilia eburnea]|uniref:hypothetical protein n=1 Tax=Massilia eburnea TaxID=1776165 RepID=UPI003D6A8CA7
MKFPDYVRPFAPNLIACGFVTCLLANRYMGFMIFFLAVPLVPWLFYSIWSVIRKPTIRPPTLVRMGIWLLGVTVILVAHAYMNAEARKEEQRVVGKIEAYIAQHGSCPATLATVGVDKDEVRNVLGMNAYVCEDGKPMFFYGSTYVPFEMENYDFTQHRWSHVYE